MNDNTDTTLGTPILRSPIKLSPNTMWKTWWGTRWVVEKILIILTSFMLQKRWDCITNNLFNWSRDVFKYFFLFLAFHIYQITKTNNSPQFGIDLAFCKRSAWPCKMYLTERKYWYPNLFLKITRDEYTNFDLTKQGIKHLIIHYFQLESCVPSLNLMV